MAPIATWRVRRLAAISAAWMLVVGLAYWPAWHAFQLWLANRGSQLGPMPMRYLDIESVVSLLDVIIFLIVWLVPPLALVAIWREARSSASVHLTLR